MTTMTKTSPEFQKKLIGLMQDNFLSYLMSAVEPATKGNRVTCEFNAGATSLAVLSEGHFYTVYMTRDASRMTVDMAADGTTRVDEVICDGEQIDFKHMIQDVTAMLNKNPTILYDRKKTEQLTY